MNKDSCCQILGMGLFNQCLDLKMKKLQKICSFGRKLWNMIFVVNQFSVEIFEKPCPECGKVIQTIKMLTEHMIRIHELETPNHNKREILSLK